MRLGHFFFFQAEDGIRDRNVTGVQTCALPISKGGAVVVEIDHADFPVFPDAHFDSASGLIRKAVIRGSVASGAADGDVEARSANQAFHKRRYVDRKSVV